MVKTLSKETNALLKLNMRYKLVLTLIAILIAFLLPTQVIKLAPDGIKPIPPIKPVAPITTALQPKPTIETVQEQKPVQSASNSLPAGSHTDWMRAAGIAESDFGFVDFIIAHESGWNPDATNASSGAHGLPQALPYSKTGCGWSDAICQLRWAQTYAHSRFGSWAAAYNFWCANGWW